MKYSPDGGRIDAHGGRSTVAELAGRWCASPSPTRASASPPTASTTCSSDFTQADGSATRPFGGLGLGLALVGRIARAHGGELELDSAEGKGTTVTMVLPVGGPSG